MPLGRRRGFEQCALSFRCPMPGTLASRHLCENAFYRNNTLKRVSERRAQVCNKGGTMAEGITCPYCGSERIAEVIYGMPAYNQELRDGLDAGELVLHGCVIESDDSMYPYECQACGRRFDDEMAKRPHAKVFFNESDYTFIEDVSNGKFQSGDERFAFGPDEDFKRTCVDLAVNLIENDPTGFERVLEEEYERTYAWYRNPTFSRLVLLGLNYGAACEDGACANWLGALYYSGDLVEQDYVKAKELYELAESKGVVQAIINLGYIYEYGRTGTPDHVKAFMQYAKAAALFDAPEALYKLGDMYSRGKVVKRDLCAAYYLYEKCLRFANEITMQAQAAIRIARLISNKENASLGIPFNLERALELYQLAERGLRVDIAQGQAYYEKRLQEALDGQERVRNMLPYQKFER